MTLEPVGTLERLCQTMNKGAGFSRAKTTSAAQAARWPGPAAGWAIKLPTGGWWTRRRGQGARTRMEAMLLSCILLLLWPSSAQADVLVQPDFDANKVPEAPMLCHASGGAG